MFKKALLATVMTVGLGLGGTSAASAHGYGELGMMDLHMMHHHMMQHYMMSLSMMSCPGRTGQESAPGMTGPGMMMGPGMTGPGMMGQGMMGQGMMGRGAMGQGMMGQGMTGQGMMGQGMMGQGSGSTPGEQLSADDVRANLERWLAWHGNSRLKVGEVKEEGDDTVLADIVTQDGSLVDRFRIDRDSGAMQRVQ